MSKEIIDHGFGVIETRETFYTEETMRQKDQKISDLEAKLAESESRFQAHKQTDARTIQCQDDLISELKQQLAEKEKENDTLTAKLEQANEIINNPNTLIFQQQELIDNLQSQIAEKEKEIEQLNACVDFYKSYYISFKEKVIDELEKVKELMRSIDMPNKPELYNNDMFGAGFDSHYIRVEKLIDNQINELKGEK